jgi:hypothetical protein
MTIIDFTTFTEVDAGGKLTVIASKITAANMLRNEDCYVYRDFGANYFDGLKITFEIYISSTAADQGIGGLGITQTTVNDQAAWATPDIRIYAYSVTPPTLNLARGSTAQDTSVGLSDNTIYYCVLSRVAGGDAVTLDIYSDAAHTTLVDSLSVSGFSTNKFRYLYGMASYNSGVSIRWDGYVQNLDIGKKPATIIF